jgi:signal transduction histidine kinase
LLKEKKLKLKVDIPKNANKVWADSREIRILFHNVLDNAIKFTKKGSISISSRLKRDSIYVKVKDTGAGIAPDMLEKVFEPFVKESASISGTGLGLSICKEIVERNDGTIEVRSKGKERGTTVIVKLPTLR